MAKHEPTPVQTWLAGPSKRLLHTRIFDVFEQQWTSRSDATRQGQFVRLECPDWVNVVALTADHEVLLIEQFRHGTAEITLEIPGGVLDSGESAEAAALRELREETGYIGHEAVQIGCVGPNPAFQNNRCYTYLVQDVQCAGEQQLDDHEEIRVLKVPLRDVGTLLRTGKITHALIVAAFAFLALERGFRFT